MRRCDRAAEQITLAFVAIALFEEGQLGGFFDSFGNNPLMQAGAHRDDGRNDDAVVAPGIDIAHEGAVDLQDVDREQFQVAEAGIAGAEIVNRQHHAHRLEFEQGGDTAVNIAHQHAFGNFQFQAGRCEASFGEHRAHTGDEVLVAKFQGRDIDGDGAAIEPGLFPAHRLAAGFMQDPAPDRHDQAGTLGHRNEAVRHHHAPVRMVPA